MSIFDIILLIIFVISLYKGYKSGLILQLCGILGVIIGVWISYNFSEKIFAHFNITDGLPRIIGYVVIVVIALLLLILIGKLLSKVLDFSGLGIINRVLGSICSLIKVIFICAIFIMAFNAINRSTNWVGEKTLDKSQLYKPLLDLSDKVFPYLGDLNKYVSGELNELESKVKEII